MFSGGPSQALRKCEMFSIWMNGIGEALYLIPDPARLASLEAHVSAGMVLPRMCYAILAKSYAVFQSFQQISAR